MQRPNSATDERPRFYGRAQSDNTNLVAIVDLELGRQLGRNFRKHLRLQFR